MAWLVPKPPHGLALEEHLRVQPSIDSHHFLPLQQEHQQESAFKHEQIYWDANSKLQNQADPLPSLAIAPIGVFSGHPFLGQALPLASSCCIDSDSVSSIDHALFFESAPYDSALDATLRVQSSRSFFVDESAMTLLSGDEDFLSSKHRFSPSSIMATGNSNATTLHSSHFASLSPACAATYAATFPDCGKSSSLVSIEAKGTGSHTSLLVYPNQEEIAGQNVFVGEKQDSNLGMDLAEASLQNNSTASAILGRSSSNGNMFTVTSSDSLSLAAVLCGFQEPSSRSGREGYDVPLPISTAVTEAAPMQMPLKCSEIFNVPPLAPLEPMPIVLPYCAPPLQPLSTISLPVVEASALNHALPTDKSSSSGFGTGTNDLSNIVTIDTTTMKVISPAYSDATANAPMPNNPALNAASGPLSKNSLQPKKDPNHLRCTFCSKFFARKCDLQRHTRIHTGEKPYTCSTCAKAFTQSSALTAHQLIHSDERPFPCQFCPKTFRDRANMQKHKRSHTGEKPYSCTLCGVCFTMSSHLHRHMRLHIIGRLRTLSQDSSSPNTVSPASTVHAS